MSRSCCAIISLFVTSWAAVCSASDATLHNKAAEMCRSLPGYDWFQSEFIFEKETTIGIINLAPESLYVRIKSKQPRLLDAAWWWNPLNDKKQPSLDWNAFRKVYEQASRVIEKHSWLAKWKSDGTGRSIELWAIGTDIGQPQDEIKNFVMPAWTDAGLAGVPEIEALARRPSGGSSTIYFSTREPRALITANFIYPGDRGDTFWMSKMELSFHPKGKRGDNYSKYFVVSPDGKWELRTYSKAIPGGGETPPPATYSGGDGSSISNAIVITATTEKTGVDAEYAYIKSHFPGSRRGGQSLMNSNGRSYDEISFTTREGKIRRLYFDITSFLGKWD